MALEVEVTDWQIPERDKNGDKDSANPHAAIRRVLEDVNPKCYPADDHAEYQQAPQPVLLLTTNVLPTMNTDKRVRLSESLDRPRERWPATTGELITDVVRNYVLGTELGT